MDTTKSELVSVESGQFHIVAGNESADMDSIVCAIVLAREFEGIPLIQCTRRALEKKLEVIYVLNKHGVDLDSILYIDEFKQLDEGVEIDLSLVDHHETNLRHSSIRMVIDHHVPDADFISVTDSIRIETPIGSCSSLVADFVDYNKNYVPLLMNAVLLDTLNGDKDYEKTTPIDNKLMNMWDNKKREELFNTLDDLRNDQSLFTVEDCLGNDYKQYGDIGVALVREPLSVFTTRTGFREDLLQFVDRKHISLLIVMSYHEGKREIGFVVHPLAGPYQLIEIFSESDLQLSDKELIYSDPFVIIKFKQNNLQATRKQVMPIVKDWANGRHM